MSFQAYRQPQLGDAVPITQERPAGKPWDWPIIVGLFATAYFLAKKLPDPMRGRD